MTVELDPEHIVEGTRFWHGDSGFIAWVALVQIVDEVRTPILLQTFPHDCAANDRRVYPIAAKRLVEAVAGGFLQSEHAETRQYHL